MSLRAIALTGLLLSATASGAFAQQSQNLDIGVDASSASQSSSSSAAVAQGGNSNSSLTINNPANTNAKINQRIKNSGSLDTTPSMGAPGLGAAGVETCYGPGTTAALSVTGFGAAFGAGQYDTSCNRRLNARTIYAFGHKEQALAIMLNEPEVAAAFGVGPARGVAAVEAGPAPVYKPMSLTTGKCKRWRGNVVGDLCLD